MTSMKPDIRRPEPEDAPAIARICRNGWKQTVEGLLSRSHQHETVEFWYGEKKVMQDIGRGRYSYVAELDGAVVGVIGGGRVSVRSGEIYVFYVDEAHRYKGIGRMLLDRLTEHHRNKGLVEQCVSVQEGNRYGQPFYEARGFEYIGKKSQSTGTGEVQTSLRFRRHI